MFGKEYEPKTADESKAFSDKYTKGFSEGYHHGLQEGYATARFPERCHCCHCRSHGDMCRFN